VSRPRGLAEWRPQAKTRLLLNQVQAVLAEYADHLPLTLRQVFYRLVGAYDYDKTEAAYERLAEALNRARRAGIVPFEAIRDDGVTVEAPLGFTGLPDFGRTVRGLAGNYRRDRLEGQPAAVEVWVEAGGMVPQAVRVADPYGIPVYSCGGFDSLPAKNDTARRAQATPSVLSTRRINSGAEDRPTVVLHIGDHDPSGVSLFTAFAEDVAQTTIDLGGKNPVTFYRVAVTPEQIDRYQLPTAVAKAHDKRAAWLGGGTVQAEALPPAALAEELRQAVETVLDLTVYDDLLEEEAAERDQLVAQVGSVFGGAR